MTIFMIGQILVAISHRKRERFFGKELMILGRVEREGQGGGGGVGSKNVSGSTVSLGYAPWKVRSSTWPGGRKIPDRERIQ